MRYRREIEVAGEPADVLAYVADFSHSSEWDPGVVESRRLTDGPTAVGSRFELIAAFRGKSLRFEYVVTELEEARRVVAHGEGDKARSDDTITVAPADGGGTRLVYEADIRLKGVRRVAEPFLGGVFRRMGDDAIDGLAATLHTRIPGAR